MKSRRCSTPQWRRLRRWWAAQLPLPCARCGMPVHPGDQWDLDHTVAVSAGGTDDTARPSHAYCNRKAGQLLRQPRRWQLEGDVPATVSRPW